MKRCVFVLWLMLFGTFGHAADELDPVNSPQADFEREINAIVRNKFYYKAGKLELGISGGMLPYDSTFNTYLVGGRLTWHLSDHYGWEIVDFQYPFSSVTSFTTGIVSDPNSQVRDLQVVRLKTLIGSNFLLSPFYGKIRFLGSSVIYLDIYLLFGVGAVNTETIQYAYGAGGFSESVAAGGWDPALNFGLGFKVYAGRVFGVVLDMRNYLSYTESYGSRGLRSNFAVSLGLSFFLPGFG